MDAIERNVPVTMIRAHLEDIPNYPVLAGYSARWYRPGDEQTWLDIWSAAEIYSVMKPETFTNDFGPPSPALEQRQCYIVDAQGRAVATASAWWLDDFEGQRYGLVHWVAVTPEYQGRGLSKPLLSIVCHRLRELGHERALLNTSAGRIPAIRLYRHFGFEPVIRNDEQAAVWQEIEAALERAAQMRTVTE
jgi:GNAT superfamily N-acetyltransferase